VWIWGKKGVLSRLGPVIFPAKFLWREDEDIPFSVLPQCYTFLKLCHYTCERLSSRSEREDSK